MNATEPQLGIQLWHVEPNGCGAVIAVHNSENGETLLWQPTLRRPGEIVQAGAIRGDLREILYARILGPVSGRQVSIVVRRFGKKARANVGFWYRVHAD